MTTDSTGTTSPLPSDVQGRMKEGVSPETLVRSSEWREPHEESKDPDESFQDKTLVDDMAALKVEEDPLTSRHTNTDLNVSIPPHRPMHDTSLTEDEPWNMTKWNPSGAQPTSSKNQDATLVDQEQDTTKVHGTGGEEEDIVDSKLTQLLDPSKNDDGRREAEGGPSFTVSRRPSALQLKPPSPQPWDLIDPPEDNMNERTLDNSVAYQLPAAGSGKFAAAQHLPAGRRLIPKSSYYFGPPAPDSAYGTPPMGHIGVHHPREILRVERDYTGGEVIQFAPIYPLELEGRLTPTQFLESINSINELLISAHSLRHAFLDNLITTMSLQLSRLIMPTHFQKELKRLRNAIDDLNTMLFNPVGLNILWPGDVAFLFLEIEYY